MLLTLNFLRFGDDGGVDLSSCSGVRPVRPKLAMHNATSQQQHHHLCQAHALLSIFRLYIPKPIVSVSVQPRKKQCSETQDLGRCSLGSLLLGTLVLTNRAYYQLTHRPCYGLTNTNKREKRETSRSEISSYCQ